MLYEDVDLKTISDRYTNSRMVPFLTHIDGVRANLVSINPRQKNDPNYGKSTIVFFFLFSFFFHRKIGCNKLFSPPDILDQEVSPPVVLDLDVSRPGRFAPGPFGPEHFTLGRFGPGRFAP